MDARVRVRPFRYGYCVEMAEAAISRLAVRSGRPERSTVPDVEAHAIGLLKFDLSRDEVTAWNPGPGRTPSEPLFVRAVDGHSDDEGWLLTVVDDADRGASDLYVLDASSTGAPSPRGGDPPARAPAPRAATGSGSRPTATAEALRTDLRSCRIGAAAPLTVSVSASSARPFTLRMTPAL